MKKPLVILIGGANGTGKTTIAHQLGCKLDIRQRIGTGYIREIIRNFMPKNRYHALHTQTYEAYKHIKNKCVVEGFLYQVNLLRKPIESCIKRAFREGTDLIIEGNHLVPGYINLEYVSLFVILQSNEKHHKLLYSKTHRKRKISKKQFQNIKKIEEFIIKQAKANNIPIIKTKVNNISSTINKILKLLSIDCINDYGYISGDQNSHRGFKCSGIG